MKTLKRAIGDLGEEISCKFLMKHGFTIRERNYLKPWGEIDIICSKDNVIHFVEVKSVVCDVNQFVTHETKKGYRPEENIHQAKLKRLSRVIQTYLMEKNEESDWRFDVLAVFIEKDLKRAKVRFISDVVL